MGLVRIAILCAVGVALLPSDRAQQEQLYQRTAAAAVWTMTYCERNETTCTLAVSFWEQFKKKAQFGAELAYDMIRNGQGKTAEAAVPSSSDAQEEAPAAVTPTAANTLTGADLKPQWRGKYAGRLGS